MEDFSDNYLSLIPDELKVQILSYLDTIDIYEVTRIPALQHLSYDKSVIKRINLHKQYRCDVAMWSGFIMHGARRELITSLNINCVYWIPGYYVRNAIEKMSNLEELYAVDTKLSLTAKDCDVYNSLCKLRVLGVTVSDTELGGNKLPVQLEHLYLHLDLVRPELVTHLSNMIGKLKSLKELWAIDLSPHHFQLAVMRLLWFLPITVTKITTAVHRAADLATINSYTTKGSVVFRTTKTDMIQMSFEKLEKPVNSIYNTWKYTDANWAILVNRLKYDHSLCLKDAKKLIIEDATLESIHFTELNLVHSKDVCCKLFISTVEAILTSPNVKSLKKLAINFCLCAQIETEEAKENQPQPLFKKARVGIKNALPGKSAFQNILANCTKIEELEIWPCTSSSSLKVTNGSLSAIHTLNSLKKLTLCDIPKHIDGQFFYSICENYKQLTSIRIKTSLTGNLLYNLYSTLPHAVALKDFRYECTYMPIDDLIAALVSAKYTKLERLVIKCQSIKTFSVAPFHTYLSNNPQLKFLCIVIYEMSKTAIREISRTLNKFSNSPEKVFTVTNNEGVYVGRIPIPHMHKKEMLEMTTNIAVLDIFNGFASS